MFVSGIQQSDSIRNIYTFLLFQILFPFRLLKDSSKSTPSEESEPELVLHTTTVLLEYSSTPHYYSTTGVLQYSTLLQYYWSTPVLHTTTLILVQDRQTSDWFWKECQTLFFWAPKSLQMVTAAMKLKDTFSWEGKL